MEKNAVVKPLFYHGGAKVSKNSAVREKKDSAVRVREESTCVLVHCMSCKRARTRKNCVK